MSYGDLVKEQAAVQSVSASPLAPSVAVQELDELRVPDDGVLHV